MSLDRGLHAAAGQEVSADAYDRYLGRWSRLFVPSLLAAAEIGSGDRAARARLPASYRAIVTDGQALAFRDACFDAVVCQLGLMFFPEPARGLAEFRRVLRNGGRAAVCVISSADKAPMWGPLADALSRYLPDQREAFHLGFALADTKRLEHMFLGAGFRDVQVKPETRHGTIASFDDYWAAVEAGTGQMPLVYLTLPDSQRRAAREEVRMKLLPYVSEGRLEMSVEMLIGSGRA
jgi:SAM-dependent methyltransferase